MKVLPGLLVVLAIAAGTGPSAAQSPAEAPSIVGAWTLNKEASDPPPDRPQGDGERRGGGGGGYGRGGGQGGYGRGGGGGGRGGGFGNHDPEEMRRRMEAMRDLLVAPDHLTITRTESIVIITGGDGRTTRLSPDGKKIKDESTGFERKTMWQEGNLVSEISGAQGKIVETFAVEADKPQLTITLRFEGGRQPNTRVVRHVYDRDQGQ